MKRDIDPFKNQVGYIEPIFNTIEGFGNSDVMNVMMVDIKSEDINPRHVKVNTSEEKF